VAGRGPAPKLAHLRQRANKKSSNAMLIAPESPEIPPIPNPDGRSWHPLTLEAWAHAWQSPMSSQWLEADADGIARLAILWDEFYKKPSAGGLQEIRLQSPLYGLSPLDRSRLQWEVARADEAERKRPAEAKRTGTHDPRTRLTAVK
jgi:hypothetical protein